MPNNVHNWQVLQYQQSLFIYHMWVPVMLGVLVTLVVFTIWKSYNDAPQKSPDYKEKDPNYVIKLNLS